MLTVWWFGSGKKSPSASEFVDRLKLGLPLYGRVLRTGQGYEISLFMAALIRARRTEKAALHETAIVMKNRSTRNYLFALEDSLGDGSTTLADLADGVHFPAVQRPVIAARITGGSVLSGLDAVRKELHRQYEYQSRRFRFSLIMLGTAFALVIYVGAMMLMVLPSIEQGTTFTSLL